MAPLTDRDQGFTLLEMLIAFLILSTALVVANQTVASAVRAFSATRDIGVADRLANEILAERVDERGTIVGAEVGQSEGYLWRIERALVSGGMIDGRLVRASVSVHNPKGKLVRTYVTYFPKLGHEPSNGDY
ncbi:prepilin-type N-terminal cleavage/methylation domain-containing protein [Sinorhizobium meliloti]|uniref:type IV pilus modification PilV family protein n=1 Tax=Rhizobium meliloti TaxID=382 RepID=UPI000518E8F9|nr:prepilin-type N-terminal cleavage/methylation domain-containing protein [Sinorhizobium meliloti]RVI77390.1 prepilin-type N-terminal cleavage/methylation domain-containing protein [Sinorhizobium meliloti]RVJ06861.1 prepilin-type N-terminal cleavage/methylation domain-containing protein [Sinorhizobium meliloti]